MSFAAAAPPRSATVVDASFLASPFGEEDTLETPGFLGFGLPISPFGEPRKRGSGFSLSGRRSIRPWAGDHPRSVASDAGMSRDRRSFPQPHASPAAVPRAGRRELTVVGHHMLN